MSAVPEQFERSAALARIEAFIEGSPANRRRADMHLLSTDKQRFGLLTDSEVRDACEVLLRANGEAVHEPGQEAPSEPAGPEPMPTPTRKRAARKRPAAQPAQPAQPVVTVKPLSGEAVDREPYLLELRSALPAEMLEAKHWLLYKLVPVPGRKKPKKVPYRINGTARGDTLDTPDDIALLASFEDAAQALRDRHDVAGLGFAVLAGWQFIDLDDCLDESGGLDARAADILKNYNGPVRRSVSGTGVHLWGFGGPFDTLAKNGSGIEAYCHGRFAAMGGGGTAGALHNLAPLVRDVLAPLHSGAAQAPAGKRDLLSEKPSQRGTVVIAESVWPEIVSALESIPSDDYGRWIDVGHALATLADQDRARAAWETWSKTSNKWQESDAARWDGFGSKATDHRHIFTLAYARGWKARDAYSGAQQTLRAVVLGEGEEPADWGEIVELTARLGEAPAYPLSGLPDVIRKGIEEVQRSVKAPFALVAASALSACAAAAQSVYDIERMPGLRGPLALWFLTKADSGDRKTECDKRFTFLAQWESEQAARVKPLRDIYDADMLGWKAGREGVEAALRAAAKSGEPSVELNETLRRVQAAKPEEPRAARLIYNNTTAEELLYQLHLWPYGLYRASEGGAFFGGHALKDDNIVGTLATLNQLWDGTGQTVDRRTSQSFRVEGARLSASIAVQSGVYDHFATRAGTLMSSSGFSARFLQCSVAGELQGKRFIEASERNSAPESDAGLRTLASQAGVLLARSIGADGKPRARELLTVRENAHTFDCWREYHNAVEHRLGPHDALDEVRAIANKVAENAARLAGVFHAIAHAAPAFGEAADLSVAEEHMVGAAERMDWHLSAALREQVVTRQEVLDAVELERWLKAQGARVRGVRKSDALQRGPYRLRDRKRLDAALLELVECGRAKMVTRKGVVYVLLHPRLR